MSFKFPQQRGTLFVTWVPQFASGDLAANYRPITSLDNGFLGLLGLYSGGAMVVSSYDGTTLASATMPAWAANDAIELVVHWDASISKMGLHYRNVTKGHLWTHVTPVAYDGSFTATGFLQLLKAAGRNNSVFRNLPVVFDQVFTATEIEEMTA